MLRASRVQQMNDNLPTTLYHAKDWRFFFPHRAATGFAFASASTAFAPLGLDYLRLSLMASHHIGFTLPVRRPSVNQVLVDLAVLHNDDEVLSRVRDQFDVLEGVAIDQQ